MPDLSDNLFLKTRGELSAAKKQLDIAVEGLLSAMEHFTAAGVPSDFNAGIEATVKNLSKFRSQIADVIEKEFSLNKRDLRKEMNRQRRAGG